MSKTDTENTRIIQINNGIIGPVEPRQISITRRSTGDYAGMPQVYLQVAENYSKRYLGGPPLCDELVALVQHLFTEEEASVVRHLKPLRLRSAAYIAKAEHRPPHEVSRILDTLAEEKRIILRTGSASRKYYGILPIIPGTFEFALMGTPFNDLTPWQKKFAVLFEELYDRGYGAYYGRLSPPLVRSVPVSRSINSQPAALPSDRLEEVLDRYDKFGVGLCSCRTSAKVNNTACDKPLEVCTGMGRSVEFLISKGLVRRAEKKEILEIKKQAEAGGLVNWMFNIDEKYGTMGNFSCSCCGCCCAIFRMVTEFNMPGLIARPHFMPSFDQENCRHCGGCAKRCQLGAITVDTINKTLAHDKKRCIGCGQCVLGCEKKAVTMKPVEKYKTPPVSWPTLGISMFPGLLRLGWNLIRK